MRAIEQALADVAGVRGSIVCYPQGRARVEAGHGVDGQALLNAVEATGYGAPFFKHVEQLSCCAG
ncbi:MAG: hypothetical protein ACM3IK_15555 [Sphingomonadaceae bacterium]